MLVVWVLFLCFVHTFVSSAKEWHVITCVYWFFAVYEWGPLLVSLNIRCLMAGGINAMNNGQMYRVALFFDRIENRETIALLWLI